MSTASTPTAIGTAVGLRCPRCAAEMAAYERSGIVVDQCPDCRGIYLDRGELERLIDAESIAGWTGPRMRIPDPIELPRATRAALGGPAHPGYASEWRSEDDDTDRRRRRGLGNETDRGHGRRPAAPGGHDLNPVSGRHHDA